MAVKLREKGNLSSIYGFISDKVQKIHEKKIPPFILFFQTQKIEMNVMFVPLK